VNALSTVGENGKMERSASSQANPEEVENSGSEINSYIKQVKYMTHETMNSDRGSDNGSSLKSYSRHLVTTVYDNARCELE